MSDTPILDLEQAPPVPGDNWKPLAVGLPLGVAIGLAPALGTLAGKLPVPPFSWLLFIPAFCLAIAVHEAGHLVAGKLVGMDPGGIAICGVVAFKSGARWVFKFEPNLIFGGMARAFPATGPMHRAQFAWMVSGGPIASLLFAIVWGAAVYRSNPSEAGLWLGSLFWTSAGVAFMALLPSYSGINKSDGARLWFLLKRQDLARSWMALLALQAEEAKGVLPRNWNCELVGEALTSDSRRSEFPYIELLIHYRCVDRRDEIGAMAHLENALANSAFVGTRLRWCIYLETVAVSARTRGNASQARIWLERARKLRKSKRTNGAEAEIAMCEHRYEDALRLLEGVRRNIARTKLDSGLARFALEQLSEYENECRVALASPAAESC